MILRPRRVSQGMSDVSTSDGLIVFACIGMMMLTTAFLVNGIAAVLWAVGLVSLAMVAGVLEWRQRRRAGGV